MSYYLFCEDLCAGLIGPFETRQSAEEHRNFLVERGDADPGTILTEEETEQKRQEWGPNGGCLYLTPEKDRMASE